jgi:predicted nucleotidyltransferase
MQGAESAAKIDQIVAALRPYRPECIYVFGSWARGEADELSDIDLVVIKRTSAPFFDRLREVARLLPDAIGGVDVLVYTPEEFAAMRRQGNAFADMIAEEAQVVYGQPAAS